MLPYYIWTIGDPYVGCTDINECLSSSKNNCTQGLDCVNLDGVDGKFRCKCKPDQQCKHLNNYIYFKIIIKVHLCAYISDTVLPKAKHTLCSTIFNEFSETFCSIGEIKYTSNTALNPKSNMETGIVDLTPYKTSLNCNGKITVPTGSRILLKFESFKVIMNRVLGKCCKFSLFFLLL